MITKYNMFESKFSTISNKDFFDTRIKWNESATSIFDLHFDELAYYDSAVWEVVDGITIELFKTTGYALLIENPTGYTYGKEKILLKTTWQENNLNEFVKNVKIKTKTSEFNI